MDKPEGVGITDYQKLSVRTLNSDLTPKETIINMVMGIAGETGEVVDLFKKHFYQEHKLDKDKIKEELGDIMFYIVNLCTLLDIDAKDMLGSNIKKLQNRYPKGFDAERSINR